MSNSPPAKYWHANKLLCQCSSLVRNGQPKIHAVSTKIWLCSDRTPTKAYPNHSPSYKHRHSGNRSNEYVNYVHMHNGGHTTVERKAIHPHRPNALHLFFENSEMCTSCIDILANLHYVHYIRICMLWVHETTTTTTKSLQNSSKETLSEYLINGNIRRKSAKSATNLRYSHPWSILMPYKNSCMHIVSHFFMYMFETTPSIPNYLHFQQKSLFQIRWHVFQLAKLRAFLEKLACKTLPISLNSNYQPIPTYHDKDHHVSWCKNVNIGLKLDSILIKSSYLFY